MGNEELAKRIAAATLSYQLGVTYQTAYKNYVDEKPVGELWFLLADLAQAGMAQSLDKFNEAVEKLSKTDEQ